MHACMISRSWISRLVDQSMTDACFKNASVAVTTDFDSQIEYHRKAVGTPH
jgi:hypothetical protein